MGFGGRRLKASRRCERLRVPLDRDAAPPRSQNRPPLEIQALRGGRLGARWRGRQCTIAAGGALMPSLDLTDFTDEQRPTGAWAAALLLALARDEAAGRLPERLTEPRLATWT